MLKNMNWRPLEQRRIDSRLVMMYEITYDLDAIPVSVYLIPNRRESRFIHPLAYRQIHTSTNYYKFSFFPRTVVHWNALPTCIAMLRNSGTVQLCCKPGGGCIPLITRLFFLSFKKTNTFLSLYKLISPTCSIFYFN